MSLLLVPQSSRTWSLQHLDELQYQLHHHYGQVQSHCHHHHHSGYSAYGLACSDGPDAELDSAVLSTCRRAMHQTQHPSKNIVHHCYADSNQSTGRAGVQHTQQHQEESNNRIAGSSSVGTTGMGRRRPELWSEASALDYEAADGGPLSRTEPQPRHSNLPEEAGGTGRQHKTSSSNISGTGKGLLQHGATVAKRSSPSSLSSPAGGRDISSYARAPDSWVLLRANMTSDRSWSLTVKLHHAAG